MFNYVQLNKQTAGNSNQIVYFFQGLLSPSFHLNARYHLLGTYIESENLTIFFLFYFIKKLMLSELLPQTILDWFVLHWIN
jgi:hypothetical protein